MLNMVVLVSGGGTNLQAIMDAIDNKTITNAKIAAVISNNADAYALTRARNKGIPAECVTRKEVPDRAEYDKALLQTVQKYAPDLVVLAGCLVVIPKIMVDAFPNKIINIHPALIPSFCGTGYYGLKVHEGVLSRGVKESCRSTAGRYSRNSAAPCDGAGRVDHYAKGYRSDCQWTR